MSIPTDPRSILITGASSGLGAALAETYAAPGRFLALNGRNAGRLAAVAAACRAKGAEVRADVTDVAARDAMFAWVEEIDDAHAVDLVIANAAVSHGTSGEKEFDAQARRVFEVNLHGVLNTIHPLVPRMSARGHGQIGIVSSIAAFHGIPGSAAYSASKAAVKCYGEGLRGLLAPRGVGVSVICPGYVRTPMVANIPFRMPFIMSAERAAGIIRARLARNVSRIGFPLPMLFLSWLGGAMPAALADAIFARMPQRDRSLD